MNVALVERHHARVADVRVTVAGLVYAADLGELFVVGPLGAYGWTDVAPGTIDPLDRRDSNGQMHK